MESSQHDFQPSASLTEQIADHIADEIICGRMAARERIRELRIARTLGVSRGSVREALLLLERRHLIKMIPRRGAMVADLSRRQLDDLYELLETLFGSIATRMAQLWDEDDRPLFAARMDAMATAAARDDLTAYADATDAFVLSALAMVRNQYLATIVDALLPVSRRALFRVRELDGQALTSDLLHWQALLEAMADQSVGRIEAVLQAMFASHREILARSVSH